MTGTLSDYHPNSELNKIFFIETAHLKYIYIAIYCRRKSSSSREFLFSHTCMTKNNLANLFYGISGLFLKQKDSCFKKIYKCPLFFHKPGWPLIWFQFHRGWLGEWRWESRKSYWFTATIMRTMCPGKFTSINLSVHILLIKTS